MSKIRTANDEATCICDGTELTIKGKVFDIHNIKDNLKFKKILDTFNSSTEFKVDLVYNKKYNYCFVEVVGVKDSDFNYTGEKEQYLAKELDKFFAINKIEFY